MRLIIFDFNGTLFNPEPKPGKIEPFATQTILSLRKKGHVVCIVSSEVRDIERSKKIQDLGFLDIVDKVEIILENDKLPAYKICIDAYKDITKECFIVGDYPLFDLLPGKKLNCKTVWYKSGKFSTFQVEGFIPDWTINKLDELISIIK